MQFTLTYAVDVRDETAAQTALDAGTAAIKNAGATVTSSALARRTAGYVVVGVETTGARWRETVEASDQAAAEQAALALHPGGTVADSRPA